MNREILFRGFAPNENGTEIAVVNGEKHKGNWVEGGYVTGAGITKLLRFEKRFNEDLAYHGCKDCGTIKTYGYKVIPETVCQYTGLKDKNGKKIFEGDIVIIKDKKEASFKGEVFFSKELTFSVKRGVGYYSDLWCWDDIKITGTIFDKEIRKAKILIMPFADADGKE